MNNFLTDRNKMYQILNELDEERKAGGGIKFERILKYYYPLFVEYGAMKVETLLEYENRLKEAYSIKDAFLICSLSSSFEWHKLNFWRKANSLPSLEEVNEHDKKNWPF